MVYGRDPKDPEILAALEHLKAEPLREYEEGKNQAKEKEAQKESDKDHPEASTDAPAEAEETPADPNAAMGMGMMAGVPGASGAAAKPLEIKYQPTVWGRYAKLLLSATEFIFIN